MSSPTIQYTWTGQVVDSNTWRDPAQTKLHNTSDIKGDDFKVRVRIISRNDDTPKEKLPFAKIVVPVTAGSGLGGASQTIMIAAGTYVSGYYNDGENGNEPVVTHIWPNNSLTNVFQGVSDTTRPFTDATNYFVPQTNIDIQGNIFCGTDPNVCLKSQQEQYIDGTRFFYIPKTINCEGPNGSLKGIQKFLGDIIKYANLIQSDLKDITGIVSNLISSATLQITSITKTLLSNVRGFLLHNINKQVANVLGSIPPFLRPDYIQKVETLTDIFLCVFQKIISNLTSNVSNLIQSIINKYVIAPICAAENFIGGLLNDLYGNLLNGLSGVFSGLNIDNTLSNIFSGISLFTGVLKFLTCEEQLDCKMPEQWSIWGGVKSFTESISTGLDKKILNSVGLGNTSSTSPSCSTSQLPCGPPRVVFNDSIGVGARGNAIVSATGAILGIDLISGGFGYSNSASIELVDDCGNGGGAVAIPIIDNTTGTIQNVVMVDTGSSYLPAPDGSTGGNGYTFSNPNDTIVENKDGYYVHPCDTTINVLVGDTIYLPKDKTAVVYNKEGNEAQTIYGKGPVSPITITATGTLTTPACSGINTFPGNQPISNGSYPAILELEDIALTNKGQNYSPNDKIDIQPSNGTELKAEVNSKGQVTNVIILNKGVGFTEMPTIKMVSETGFNAGFVPVFKIKHVGDIPETELPSDTAVINVVDCVGRVIQ